MDKKKSVKVANKTTNKTTNKTAAKTNSAPKTIGKTKKPKPQIEEFTLPIKKRKILKKKPPKIQTIFGYRTGQKVQMTEKGKPIIPFKRKIANIIKGRKYDKDGVEVQETLKSRLMKFAKKRGKKTVKKQFKKQIKNWWGSLQGVSKVAVISIGGVGITAAVAVPTVLANTIWKADKYNVSVDQSFKNKVTIAKQDKTDDKGNLLFLVSVSDKNYVIEDIQTVTKGKYTLKRDDTKVEFESKIHEYTFKLNSDEALGGILTIDKNAVGTNKGDIVVTPSIKNIGSVKSVSIKTEATKKAFSVFETFSSNGLALKATYSSGLSREITTGYTTNFDGHSFTSDEIGDVTVIVTYQGCTAEYQCQVSDYAFDETTYHDLTTHLIYKKIKGCNKCVVSYSKDKGDLPDELCISGSIEVSATDSWDIIGIEADAFKDLNENQRNIKLTIQDQNLQFINAGAFNNNKIDSITIETGDLWKIDDGTNVYCSISTTNDPETETPVSAEEIAKLFRGNEYLADKRISNTGEFSPVYSGMIPIQIHLFTKYVSPSSVHFKYPNRILMINVDDKGPSAPLSRLYPVSSIGVSDSPTFNGCKEISISETVNEIQGSPFKGAGQNIQKIHLCTTSNWVEHYYDEEEEPKSEPVEEGKLSNPESAAIFMKNLQANRDLCINTYDDEVTGVIKYKDCDDSTTYKSIYHDPTDTTNSIKELYINPSYRQEALITTIGLDLESNYGAFENMTNLRTVLIPKTIKSIKTKAFKNCSSLKQIYYFGTIDEWKSVSRDNGWHEGIPATTTKVICFDGTADLDAAA